MGQRHQRDPIVPAIPAAKKDPELPPSADQPDVRLVIEESDQPGSYIYKTLDRRTGEVLQQFPRVELLRLRDEEDYRSGSVVSTRA